MFARDGAPLCFKAIGGIWQGGGPGVAGEENYEEKYDVIVCRLSVDRLHKQSESGEISRKIRVCQKAPELPECLDDELSQA